MTSRQQNCGGSGCWLQRGVRHLLLMSSKLDDAIMHSLRIASRPRAANGENLSPDRRSEFLRERAKLTTRQQRKIALWNNMPPPHFVMENADEYTNALKRCPLLLDALARLREAAECHRRGDSRKLRDPIRRTRHCLSCPILSGYQLCFDNEINAYLGMPNEKS